METQKNKTLDNSLLNSKLKEVSVVAWQELCLMEIREPGAGISLDARPDIVVAVDFWGPCHGKLKISLFGPLLLPMASGMLGETHPSSRDQLGVLKELANVICGQILPSVNHDESFTIGSPYSSDVADNSKPMGDPTGETVLSFSNGHAVVSIFVIR